MSLGSSTPGGPVDLEGVNIGKETGSMFGDGLFSGLPGLGGMGMPGFSQTNQSSAYSSGVFNNEMGGGMSVIGGGNRGNASMWLLLGAGTLLYLMVKRK